MKEILKKIRRYEIKIRKEVRNRMHGDYTSVFKGSGLEFSGVREYQYGDDVRAIDWNVTAKGHGTFIKTFKEEKEQNVFFILDISASLEVGSLDTKKINIAKEITAILALSASREQGTVGLICYSDKKELYIPANKGLKHAYYILTKLYKLQNNSLKTNLSECLAYTLKVLKRKSVVILISDFIDQNYEHNLTAMARKHDLIIIHIWDSFEYNFPKLGIIPVLDKESRKTKWINTSSSEFRQRLKKSFEERKEFLLNLCRKNNSSFLSVNIQEEYVPELVKLFKHRKRS